MALAIEKAPEEHARTRSSHAKDEPDVATEASELKSQVKLLKGENERLYQQFINSEQIKMLQEREIKKLEGRTGRRIKQVQALAVENKEQRLEIERLEDEIRKLKEERNAMKPENESAKNQDGSHKRDYVRKTLLKRGSEVEHKLARLTQLADLNAGCG